MRLVQFAPGSIPSDYPENFRRTKYYKSLDLYIGEYYGSESHTDYVGAYPVPESDRSYGFRITKLAMRNRFTSAEKIAIEEAAASSAAVRVYKDDLAASTFIDLKRADTIASVQGLEASGLIASGRAAVILDTEATQEEAYFG